MPTLLHLDSSPLPTSISRELAAEFSKTWNHKHPDGKVIYRDLATNPAKPVDTTWIYSAYTPEDARSAEQKSALAHSDELIAELEQADEYVIGVAMHNFSIPSVLKLWVDQIARNGRTFSYGSAGPEGLLKGKKATLIVASGGVYEPGTPMGAYNFSDPYLRTILGFLGVTDVHVISAGGAAQVMTGAVDRGTFLKPSLDVVRNAVA
ncbi:FMN-dependent NADH-azoreductase [Acidicapsa ligni]|uniref:FMN-dependent NADH-azoreductase n=1 Tax=Acidicapsa ligni TaxID=542300 RepID=UPI0021E0D206|nr:NAD(P)H-dependent oxidoreductase [Acidicapsa ligni]